MRTIATCTLSACLLLAALLAAGCGSIAQPAVQAAAFATPSGDAGRGAALFASGKGAAPPCINCHATASGAFSLGPALVGVAARAQERAALAADDYLRQSIMAPKEVIAPGYRDMMYAGYSDALSSQDLEDLVAYLLTL